MINSSGVTDRVDMEVIYLSSVCLMEAPTHYIIDIYIII